MVLHPEDISCPAELYFEEHGLDAGDRQYFENPDVGERVTPAEAYDDAKTALMITPDVATRYKKLYLKSVT